MILLPDDTGISSTHWIAVGESTRLECLDDYNGGTSYVKCNDHLESMIIEYANPSVAGADIASIESVAFVSSGRAIHRTDPSLVDISFAAPTAGFSETASYDAHRTNYETVTGTARTTSDGSNAWTYSDLESFSMMCTKNGSIEIYLSYLSLKVNYTEAVSADNATFFGANF